MERKRVLILGAAGRDFHNFNMLFRDDESYNVVGFTANQIPFIADRRYPKELSGDLYPEGIPIHDESEMPRLIKKFKVEVCVMAYSDVAYNDLMEKASLANANGADFWLVAPERTMLTSNKPVVAVCGTRTGVGKSQTSRYVSLLLRKAGFSVGIIRHPMPYGILKDQAVQRFASLKDLTKYKATIEEREDYEPHINNGFVVYAGVDYKEVLGLAELENDVIIWDGGNNDTSFIKPDLMIGIADPLRAGNEITYYPGETVARMSDLLIVNKANSATKDDIARVVADLKAINQRAKIILADSIVKADNGNAIKGKRALLVEDGPTITHGGMTFGAATVAAKEFGAGEVVDAKRYAVGTIKDIYKKYPKLGKELPAVGYSPKQIRDLQNTLIAADCDVVISATPTDLRRIVNIDKPIVNISYELKPRSGDLDRLIKLFAEKIKK